MSSTKSKKDELTDQIVTATVIDLVAKAVGDKPARIGPETMLFSSLKTFDSFALLELVLRLESTFGCTGGRNLAFTLASRDRLLILDNDVVLPQDSAWLQTLWQTMDSNPRASIVAPMLVFADRPEIVQATGIGLTDRGRVGYINRGRSTKSIRQDVIEVIATPTACWLMRKEAQEQVGLFLEMFHPVQYEDVDLCVRLHLAGWKTLCDCNVQIKHIENVTTRNLKEYPFARLTVRN